jgi:predicted esterase
VSTPSSSSLSFVHRYEPATDPGAPTLLALHGTGGDENDLIPLAHELMPGAGILSPRGQVLERGAPRFFRRLAEGVFDEADLRLRTGQLADFIFEAADRYRLDRTRIVAVGFSNGANIASSLLLLKPKSLGGAVLIRAMVPLVPDPLPALPGTPVLVTNGKADPLVSQKETDRLVLLLRNAGANVTVALQQAGHNLAAGDIETASAFLQHHFRAPK